MTDGWTDDQMEKEISRYEQHQMGNSGRPREQWSLVIGEWYRELWNCHASTNRVGVQTTAVNSIKQSSNLKLHTVIDQDPHCSLKPPGATILGGHLSSSNCLHLGGQYPPLLGVTSGSGGRRISGTMRGSSPSQQESMTWLQG